MNKKEAKQLLLSKDINAIKKFIGNKFFSVEFYKKDGTLRKMQCRLGVTKHLKGGTKSYDSDASDHGGIWNLPPLEQTAVQDQCRLFPTQAIWFAPMMLWSYL